MKYKFLLLAIAGYLVLFFTLLPLNRYCLNADGIAYIQQARLYAAGHFGLALNGCWNGLICILLAPFIKIGFDPVLSFKCLNGFLGALCIVSFYKLSARFIKDQLLLSLFPFVLAIIVLSYSMQLLSPDVLQLFLLSIYLNIICSPFTGSAKKLVLCGITGALCYFAKAYNFYFFIINTAVAVYLSLPKETGKTHFGVFTKKLAIAIGAFMILALPYIILLSGKYHKFTVSTASPITINKSLEPSFTDGKKLLVPPPNPYALAIADDPSLMQEKYITPLTSSHYFFKQLKITLANFFEYAKLLTNISIFAIAIFLAFALYLLVKKKAGRATDEMVLFFTACFYPLGYLLIAIEWRYVWLIPILLLIMAFILLPQIRNYLAKPFYIILVAFIAGSFLAMPVLSVIHLNNQPEVYSTANALKANGINGNFVANISDSDKASNSYYYAYLTNSKLFGLFAPSYTYEELMEAAKKYDIRYFYYYFNSPLEKEAALASPYAKNAVKVFDNVSGDMLVFQLQ